MDKLQRDLDTVDTYIERARKMLDSAHLQLACARAILDSPADDVEIDPAPGEADANAVLANSLNDQVIQQHYIDALKSIGKDGNLVVVPEGSQPIVGTK